MDKRDLVVGGYMFPNYREAQVAMKELKNIETIKSRTDFKDKNSLLGMYNKLIERDFFKTIIGYEFLSEVRHILTDDYYCLDNELPTIKVSYMSATEQIDTVNLDKLSNQVNNLTIVKKRLTIAVVSLSVLIAGMFFIAATNKNVGYINTENKILDKYSGWEEELSAREEAVKLKEEALEKATEENINNNKEK